MPAAKKKIEIDPEKSQTEIETMSLELQANSIEVQAQKELTPEMFKALKKIAYYTSKVGLTLEESCALVDIPHINFVNEMKMSPIIGKVIKMKELEYKKDLMFTISQRAKAGDDKLAQWLLERRYPEEFGAKKAAPIGDDEDLFFQAIQFIRKKGDSSSLIQPESGRAVVVTRATVIQEKRQFEDLDNRIDTILNG